VCYVNNVT